MIRQNARTSILAIVSLALSSLGFVQASHAITPGNGTCDFITGADSSITNAGQQSNPFPIAGVNDLEELRECIEVGSTTGVYFSITSNIDLLTSANSPWAPLGSVSKKFNGHLDGQGFSLNGIYLADTSYSGLFAYTDSNASFHNISLEASVTGNIAGALVGMAEPGIQVSSISSKVTFRTTALTSGTPQLGGLVGGIKDKILSSDKKMSTFSNLAIAASGEVNHTMVGGVLGKAEYTGLVTITGARVSGGWSRTATTGAPRVGGLVGYAYGVKIINSQVRASLAEASFGSTGNMAGDLGGLVGRLTSGSIEGSSFRGSLTYGGVMSGGGLAGHIDKELTGSKFDGGGYTSAIRNGIISGSYAITVAHVHGGGNLTAGGVAGVASIGAYFNAFSQLDLRKAGGTSSRHGGVFGYDASNQTFSSVYWSSPTIVNAFGISDTSRTTATGIAKIASQDVGDPTKFPNFDIASSATFNGANYWNICDFPYLTAEGQDGCAPTIISAVLASNGKTLTVETTATLAASQTPSSSLTVFVGGSVASLTQDTLSVSGKGFSVTLVEEVQKGQRVSLSYLDDNADPLRTSTNFNVSPVSNWPVANASAITGPSASLGAATSLSSEISIPLTCSSSCGSADSYTYVASITPANGAPSTISGTATSSTTTLSFTALSSNVTHTIRASVTFNGQTSATVSTTVTTPRPIATISAIAIADTSATLTVGCSNCGAAPSSFTVSATPVLGGGAAITSNTSVITGLTSETTYSFSVVVAFAGTTSNSVLWQGNPVRTLPFVPVISNVSPSFLPLGGGQVTVTGANFSTSNQLSLRGVTLSFTIVNGTTITFTAPSDGAGSFDLAIRNPVGTYTLSSAITYVLAPTLSTNSPTLGTTNGGTIVTLTGANLLGTSRVNLGTTTVSFTVISDSKIRFTTPATSAAVVDIGVVTAGGPATLSNGIEFTSSALIPVITSITPANGPIAGGTTVTVIGQFFSGSYSDSISAAINGVSGSAIVLIDDSTFTFVTPAHPAGVGLDFSVFTGGGLGILMGAFTYTAPPVQAPQTPVSGGSGGSSFTAPEIFSFSSRVLLSSGGTITLTGKSLEFVSSLKLGGILVTVVTNSATSLTFTAGTLPVGTWDLELINIYGKLTYLSAIEVKAPEAPIKGTLIGSRWSTVFLGNSRVLNPAQVAGIRAAQQQFAYAKTVVCYGYTTNRSPNAWATNHALSRATAVCEGLKKLNPALRTQVRLRFGESKSFAMRSSMQFWK